MAKLHELLAVEANLKKQVESMRSDLMNTFEKKKHHFTEKRVTFQPNEEGAQPITEEQLDLQTTISKELQWIGETWSKAISVIHQIADANTRATANVILEDGTAIFQNIPATMLLDLEKRLTELHSFVSSIPTLDPAKGFKPDPDRGVDVFKAREDERIRTKKVQKPVILYPATDKHPAQVQMVSEDIPVGLIRVQEWSGLITTAEKGKMLERVEELQRAVKQARSRANEAAVNESTLGQKLLSYIFIG